MKDPEILDTLLAAGQVKKALIFEALIQLTPGRLKAA